MLSSAYTTGGSLAPEINRLSQTAPPVVYTELTLRTLQITLNPKLKQLTTRFPQSQIDSFLVTSDVNIRYLTDFPASESWLFVSAARSFYLTDFRYVLEAQKGLKGIPVKRTTTSLYPAVFEVAQSLKTRRIGFDDRHLSLAAFKKLKQKCPKGIQLIPVQNLVEDLREIKSADEIRQIRRALSLHRQAYALIKKEVKPGVTEKEIYNILENFVKSHNAGFSLSPIIAAGPNP